MNKWEDSFKKTSSENNGNKMCHCSNDQGLFVPNRQLSIVVALLLLVAFSIFMAGYFLGKKKAVEQFAEKIHQEAFADQIYTTVLSAAQDQQSAHNNLLVTNIDDSTLLPESINQDVVAVEQGIVITQSSLQDASESIQQQRYYAQLIGFGTEKAAQLFVKKLSIKGIETEVKKRVSKTVKGHTSYWYQVVTATYSNKNDLSAVVDRLAKEENIKGACIRSC